MSFTLACSLISECKQDITTPREYKAPDLVFFPIFFFRAAAVMDVFLCVFPESADRYWCS